MSNIDNGVIEELIYVLVNRALNARTGKKFRAKKVSRVNDVTFRTMLKIKCEEGNVR